MGQRNRPTRTSPSSVGSRRTDPHTGDNTYPSTAWHPEFADINNDRLIDLFVSKETSKHSPTMPRTRATCCSVSPMAHSSSRP